MYMTGQFNSTVEIDVEVTYSYTPELAATRDAPAEGGIEIEAVWLKARDGTSVDITHLIPADQLEDMLECARLEHDEGGQKEWDDE